MVDVGAARIAVASPLIEFHHQLNLVYPHQRDGGGDVPFADIRVALTPGSKLRFWGRQVRLWSESQAPFEPYPIGSALPLFEWGSNWLLSQRLNAYLLLHAGVVARGDQAVILPAQPGSGKSTLTCALHLAGWRFFSDEFGVIDMERGLVLPMLKPAALKNASIEVIRQHTNAVLGPVFSGTRKGDVAHFVPDKESFEERRTGAHPHMVVFPRYVAGAPLRCLPVPPTEAVMRIGLNSFNYQTLGPLGFDAAVRIARQARAYDLSYGDLNDALACIETLFDQTP
ncbi:MAG: HprK-related kinase A [Zoogloeaceae bacterium]|nr:HprK-related kinase A [Zoogloeaceae bacterium]